MWVSQLELVNFRNYRRLGLHLRPGVLVFCGQNGQGKTNLLEAIYVLATTRSPRTSSERELVSWLATTDDPDEAAVVPPFARVEGRLRRGGAGEVHLEVLFQGEPGARERTLDEQTGTPGEVTGALARSIKVNGVPTRAAGLVGNLLVVYFGPEDVALAGGPPAGRRRYLDLANAQVAPLYLRALQQYNRILLQRNQVLRQIRERRQPRSAVDPWTEQMVRSGVFVLLHRLQMLARVNELLGAIFRDLTGAGAGHDLRIAYRATAAEGDDVGDAGAPSESLARDDAEVLARRYLARQEALREREVEQAASLVGPHRDDFTFMLNGVDLNTYGSRGQQRLAVLALKLAEVEWMRGEANERPILLLDDVLSELDPAKRRYVLERIAAPRAPDAGDDDAPQVWITTTDTDSFPADLLASARRFIIDAGTVRPA